jgi:hypothetical protein
MPASYAPWLEIFLTYEMIVLPGEMISLPSSAIFLPRGTIFLPGKMSEQVRGKVFLVRKMKNLPEKIPASCRKTFPLGRKTNYQPRKIADLPRKMPDLINSNLNPSALHPDPISPHSSALCLSIFCPVPCLEMGHWNKCSFVPDGTHFPFAWRPSDESLDYDLSPFGLSES